MEDSLAKDLVALWQSELTAMAADREVRETWTGMMALWAYSANTALAYLPHDIASRSAGTPQPQGAAATAAAPQPGMGEVEQLNRRVAELEQRLAEFMAGRDGAAGPGGPAKKL